MANNYYVPKIQRMSYVYLYRTEEKNGLKGFLKTYDD